MTTMTIGALSRRTGVPVKTLRAYEDLGLIYNVGRSPGNYRLFGEEALWCVETVTGLRKLGLTLAEIQELSEVYLHRDEPLGPRFADLLAAVRARTETRIAELRYRLACIDQVESEHAAELAGRAELADDERRVSPEGA
ncbi:MAG: MerR family transcriptional regulator [Pseudonocardiaceae bacterium]